MKYCLLLPPPFTIALNGELRELRLESPAGSGTGRLIHAQAGASVHAPYRMVYESHTPATLLREMMETGFDPHFPACRAVLERAVQEGKAERLP